MQGMHAQPGQSCSLVLAISADISLGPVPARQQRPTAKVHSSSTVVPDPRSLKDTAMVSCRGGQCEPDLDNGVGFIRLSALVRCSPGATSLVVR